MLYNSFPFIFCFLPLCLVLYFSASAVSRALANITLALLSVAFYAYWDWRNVPILVGSILFNYAIGYRLRRGAIANEDEMELAGSTLRTVGSDARNGMRNGPPASGGAVLELGTAETPVPRGRAIPAFGVVANLALLAYFKFRHFGTAPSVLGTANWLPLGISFFTFTQIAFLVDAWRGEAAELDFWRYGLFVTFFPHLIAGPIVHHRELMPQFARESARWWKSRNVNLGIAFFALGLFKKVAMADSLAPWANNVFAAAGPVDLGQSWLGALSYGLQLYFDFSGYSDMAIGLGLMFNVRLPDNFDAPYRAASIADFWRRWHMTLSRFLRDYLYIPLGGNRKGEDRQRFNLMVTMLLGGLWHGAGWTFVVWGGYHGVLLVLNRAWSSRKLALLPILSRPLTFFAVTVGWVIFRADTLHRAGSLLASMTGWHGAAADPKLLWQFGALGVLIAFVNVAPTTRQWIENKPLGGWRGAIVATLLFFALLCMRTALTTHKPSPFLYFQF